MNLEIELKLKVPEGSAAKLSRHPLLKGESKTVKLFSIYYDTPSLDLKAKGVAIRLRKSAGKWIQTVKGRGGVVAGVHTRHEWDLPVPKNALDLTRFDDPFLVDIFSDPEIRHQLAPVFSTEFSRKLLLLEYSGSSIECSFDRGSITSGEKAEPISELELELKSGDPAALYDFALELLESIPLEIETVSKAGRGYSLFLGAEAHRVKKAETPAIVAGMSVREAFLEIAQNCLIQIQENARGMLAGEEDPEFLHQMRVGVRRMRSAFSIFSRHFGKEAFLEVVSGLRWLGGELGPARNWDVFLQETLPSVESALPEQDFSILRERAQSIREKNRNRAICAVASPKYQSLLLKLGALLCRIEQAEPLAVEEFANEILSRRCRNFERAGKGIASLDHLELHALRIEGKKLRYAAEFFIALHPSRSSRNFLSTIGAMQDALGAINDAATTGHLLDELAGEIPEASGIMKGWVARDTAANLAQLPPRWKSFRRAKRFWT
ncbi:MAG: CYTH and CHAD domain-containing protein [Burkholderiales bacterium]|nr:CYTH and CHAD domain-containing protein [Burkholderiales bacterium]